jgi:hypothetical protein
MGDQPVARPLPINKHRINVDIHAFNGIRTHDPGVRAGEDISCLRPRSPCDRLTPSSPLKFGLGFQRTTRNSIPEHSNFRD